METGELLIQKRAKDKDSWPDLWDISAAGHGTHPLPLAFIHNVDLFDISAACSDALGAGGSSHAPGVQPVVFVRVFSTGTASHSVECGLQSRRVTRA